MATPTANGGQLTVTVTASISSTPDPTTTDAAIDIASSTISLIYIWSTSTSSEPTSAASSSGSSERISGGAIAGIVVGSVAFLVILALALFCYSRNVARRRRAEIASLHPSRHAPASRAESHAAAATTTKVQGRPSPSPGSRRNSRHARSAGARSAATPTRPVDAVGSPRLKAEAPPQELPTPHNRPELEGSRGARPPSRPQQQQKQPGVSEVYGSHTYPVELHAGSMSDLASVIQEMKRLKTSGVGARGKGLESDAGSEGYISPAWPPGGAMSSDTALVGDTDWMTDAGDGTETEYGDASAEERSIHIYFRPGSGWDAGSSPLSSRQSKIAAAISQASSTKTFRSTMGSSTTMTK